MSKRKQVSKRTRFEVFKRDSFTCQYCGKKAPDVVLHLDHIQPVVEGGTNEIRNLVTSCQGCNAGKGAVPLSDNSVVGAETPRPESEQVDMAIKRHKSHKSLDSIAMDRIEEYWCEEVWRPGFTESGSRRICRLLKDSTVEEILVAIDTAIEGYIRYGTKGVKKESVDLAFSKLGGILKNKRLEAENPEIGEILHIRNIARLNCDMSPSESKKAYRLLMDVRREGAPLEELKRIARASKDVQGFIDEAWGAVPS